MFIGQNRAQDIIDIKFKSYLASHKTLPHFGVFGSSGNGKTLLGQEILHKFGCTKFQHINVTSIKTLQNLQGLLVRNLPIINGVIIDEAHILNKQISNTLLSCLEIPHTLSLPLPKRQIFDGRIYDKGEIISQELDPFILILTSNHKDRLDAPLLNRLTVIDLEKYTFDEYKQIAQNFLIDQGAELEPYLTDQLCQIARNVRFLKKLLTAAMEIKMSHGAVTFDKVKSIFGIDNNGLLTIEVKYLKILVKYQLLGLQAISAQLGLNTDYILEFIEPFLIEQDLIEITGHGRCLTSKGKILGVTLV